MNRKARVLVIAPCAWAVMVILWGANIQAAPHATGGIQQQEQIPVTAGQDIAGPLIHTDQQPGKAFAELLDDARLKYLEGSAAEALLLLDSAAIGQADVEQRVAWLELYAFLLTATGAHQAAFDSLHRMYTLQTRNLQEQRVALERQYTDSLEAWSGERSTMLGTSRVREDELLSTNRILLYTLAGLIIIAGILVVLLLFSRRTREAKAPPGPIPPVPARSITPSIQGAPAIGNVVTVAEGPAGGLLPHVERLSKLVSGGSTIEAAVHLDVMKRYMRLLEPLEVQEWLPLQQTVTLLRQHLKMSALLLDVRPEHVVNVAGDLRDAPVNVPARSLLAVLQEVMPGVQTPVPRTSVEFSKEDNGALIRCTIRTNGRDVSNDWIIQANSIPGVVARDTSTGNEGIGIEVEWPASLQVPAR